MAIILNKREKITPPQAIEKVAVRNGVSVEEVRHDISQAIRLGMSDANPQARLFWNNFLKDGDMPDPEGVIAYLAQKVKKDNVPGP